MFIAAAAALVFASCTKSEITSSLYDEETPVAFSNYAPRSLTKADGTLVNSGALPAGSEIGIYGYSDGTNNLADNAGTIKPTFMDNAHVTYSGVTSATATATDPVRYWPKTTTNILSFYGYYPYNNAAITSKPSSANAGLGTFGFTQPAAVANMVDFMVSNVANDQYYWATGDEANANGVKATDGIVPLTFNHMLSKVNFKFSHNVTLATGDKIVVTSVSVAKVNTKGTLTPSYTAGAAGSLGTTTFSWGSTANTPATITIPIYDEGDGGQLMVKDTPKINNGSDGTAKSADTDFLFIPQSIGDDVVITINYDIIQGGNTTHNVAEKKLNVIEFGGSALTAWEINKFYTYSFIIGLHEIKFTGNVVAWDDEGTGSLNI